MRVRLVSAAPDIEKTILYCARVSNPKNQDSSDVRLLDYCVKHGHWSIFEQGFLTFEIETSRAISAQILRHRSFTFQEFSQRYSKADEVEIYEARRQDKENRQNSIDDLSGDAKDWFRNAQVETKERQFKLYEEALERGVCKEQARFLLPLSTRTRLYMSGSVRSWIHYLTLRCAKETQKEHRDVAEAIREIFISLLPNIAHSLNWAGDRAGAAL